MKSGTKLRKFYIKTQKSVKNWHWHAKIWYKSTNFQFHTKKSTKILKKTRNFKVKIPQNRNFSALMDRSLQGSRTNRQTDTHVTWHCTIHHFNSRKKDVIIKKEILKIIKNRIFVIKNYLSPLGRSRPSGPSQRMSLTKSGSSTNPLQVRTILAPTGLTRFPPSGRITNFGCPSPKTAPIFK